MKSHSDNFTPDLKRPLCVVMSIQQFSQYYFFPLTLATSIMVDQISNQLKMNVDNPNEAAIHPHRESKIVTSH